MESIQIRDAKAKFSALVEAAEHGRPTTITRHGRPAAVMIPIADARRLRAILIKVEQDGTPGGALGNL